MEKVPNLICTLWNRSSHWNNSINSNSNFQLWNGTDPNSNFSLGIGATTPTPIQRSGEDSNVCFESVKKLKKDVNQMSLVVVLLLVKPGWRERNSNREFLGIPPFLDVSPKAA